MVKIPLLACDVTGSEKTNAVGLVEPVVSSVIHLDTYS